MTEPTEEEQIRRLASYLKNEWEGYAGVPVELVELETQCSAKHLPSWLTAEGKRGSGKFYRFEDLARAIVVDLSKYVKIHLCPEY